MNVGSWVLKDAVDYTFAPSAVIRPGDYIVLVAFDPADATALNAFRTTYALPIGVPVYGPYTPKLSNSSGTIELAYPSVPVAGEVPFVLVDRVAYADAAPWPTGPDGTGPSLQRLSRTAFGNDPINWTSATATPGNVNTGQTPIVDSDGDGMPDTWETLNGFDPKSAADGVQDLDGDGKSNTDEYLAGTDPRNSASLFSSEVTRTGTGYAIRFTAIANKSYTVQFRDSLSSGVWQKVADIPAQGTQHPVEVNDTSSAAQRFYRVITPQQP